MPLFSVNAQQTDRWENWKSLIGDWLGEGSGEPGDGSGSFSFTFDLEQNILVRKHNYVYIKDKAYLVFNDMTIIYLVNGTPSKAIFFDSEGYSRNYTISYSGKTITLISEKIPQMPTFRITYTLIDDANVIYRYEISRDGVNYITYVEETGKKKLLTSGQGN